MTDVPDSLRKPTWQERCVKVYEYHIAKVRENRGTNWTVRNTAEQLNRAVGPISEDLILAEFLRAHPELEKIRRISDATAWIKEYKLTHRQRR